MSETESLYNDVVSAIPRLTNLELDRSHGVCHEPWNLTVVCNFHHDLIHKKHVGLKGRASAALEWTPPKLMQAVFDRRRNRPSIWLGELDVREWSLESRAAPS